MNRNVLREEIIVSDTTTGTHALPPPTVFRPAGASLIGLIHHWYSRPVTPHGIAQARPYSLVGEMEEDKFAGGRYVDDGEALLVDSS